MGNKVDYTTDLAEITNSTSVMMTTVAGNKYAIGYISLGSLGDEVKALKAFFDSVVVLNKKICVYKNSYSDKYNKLAKVFGGKGV